MIVVVLSVLRCHACFFQAANRSKPVSFGSAFSTSEIQETEASSVYLLLLTLYARSLTRLVSMTPLLDGYQPVRKAKTNKPGL